MASASPSRDASPNLKRPLRRDRQATAAKLTKPFRSPLHPSAGRERPSTPAKAVKNVKPAPLDNTADQADSPSSVSRDDNVDVNALYREYTTLSRQLTQMRQSLDTAQQALNILEHDQTSSTQSLIDKWKTVVQNAAEELFDTAKQQVQQQGGLIRSPIRSFLDDDGELQLSAEHREMLAAQQEEEHAQALKYGLSRNIEPGEQLETDKVSES